MNRQRSTMISLMNTMTKSTDLYSQAINSAGTSTQIQEKYMESFNGKLGTLKASFESLSANALNGDFMKGSIDVLSGFIGALDKSTQTLGVLPTAITAVVGAMTLFNAKFRENTTITMQGLIPSYNKLVTNMQGIDKQLTSSIQKYKAQIDFQRKFATGQAQEAIATDNLGKSMIGLNAKLALSTTGLVACRFAAVALQAAMSMGLSLAITGAISLFSNLINASSKAKEEVKSLNQEFLNNKDAINTNKADVLVKQYESLQATLKTMKSGTDEFKEAENQLLQVEQKIIDTYPNASVSIDNNTQAKKLNLSMTKDLINADLELAKGSANDVLSKNKVDGSDNSIQTVIDGYENYKRVVEELNKYTADVGKGIRETTDFINVEVKAVDGSTNVWKVKTDSIGHYTDKLQEATESSKAIYEALVIMAEANGYSAEKIVELGKVLGLTDAQIAESTSGMTVFKDVVNEVSNITNNAVSSIDTLANSFSGLNQPIELLRTMIDEFTQFGQISDSSWNSVLTSGNTELIALLSDSNNFLVNAQGLLDTNIAKQEDYAQSIINTAVAQQNASNAVIDGVNAEANATVNAENSKINASVMSANNRIDNEKELVDANNKNFGIDADNFSLFATAKQNASDTLANGMIDSTKSMVDSNNSNYSIDASNYVDYINTKINAFREFQKAQNGGFTISRDIMKDFDEVKKIRDEYNQLQKDIANSSSNAVNSYSGSGGVGGGVSHGAIGSSGSGGTTGTTGSGSNDTEKEVTDIEDLTSRYLELENALKDVNNALEKNNILQNADGADKSKLIEEEIELLKQKQDALSNLNDEQKKEAEELRKYLENNQYTFDENGNVTNQNELLDSRVDRANNELTGDYKETYKEWLKYQQQVLDRYNELTKDTIDKTSNEWEELNNQISKLLTEQTASQINAITKELDKLSSAHDKTMDKINETATQDSNYNYIYDSVQIATNKYKEQEQYVASLTAKLEELNAVNATTTEAQDELANSIEETKSKLEEEKNELDKIYGELEIANMNFIKQIYDSAKYSIVTQQMGKIDLELEIDGDADLSNRLDLLNDKLKLQEELVGKADTAYQDLTNSTHYTADSYEEWVEQVNSAEEELIQQQTQLQKLKEEIDRLKLDKIKDDLANITKELDKLNLKLELQKEIDGDINGDLNVKYYLDKIELQNKAIEESMKKLEELKNTTVETADGEKALADQIAEAEDSLIQQQIEAQKLKEEYEKLQVAITKSIWNDKMWEIFDFKIPEIDLKLQVTTEDDVETQFKLMQEKLLLQQQALQETLDYQNQLSAMRDQEGITADAYAQLTEEMKNAISEINSQKSAINSLNKEIDNLLKGSLKEYYDKLKEEETTELEAKRKQELIDLENEYFKVSVEDYDKYKQSHLSALKDEIAELEKKLELEGENSAILDMIKAKKIELSELEKQNYEDIQSWYDVHAEMHQANIDAIDKELEALEERNALEEEREERLQKQQDILEAQERIENIKKNKNIRELSKNADGSWGFEYTYDKKELDDANKDYKDKVEALDKWEKDLEEQKYKDKLNAQKKYEQEALDLLKKQYDEQLKLLEEKQKEEEELLDEKYKELLESIEKLSGEEVRKKYEEILGAREEFNDAELESITERYKKEAELLDEKYKESAKTLDDKYSSETEKLNKHNDEMYSVVDSFSETMSDKYSTMWDGISDSMKDSLDLGLGYFDKFQNAIIDKVKSVKDEIDRLIKLSNQLDVVGSGVYSASSYAMSDNYIADSASRSLNSVSGYNTSGSSNISNYTIDNVSFPNITSADEATKALMNIDVVAKQKARK